MLVVGIGSPSEAVSATLTSTTTRYAISDGDELSGYPLPRTWTTPQEAEQVAANLCYHPRLMRMRPHVVPVLVTMTKYGTVLSVQEIPRH